MAIHERLGRVVAGDERSVQRALLLPVLGAIAIKDLALNDLPRRILVWPDELRLPWGPLGSVPYNPGADLVCFVLLIFAFMCAMAVASGRFARVSGALLLVLYAYTFAADQLIYTNNVFFFMTLLGLAIVEPSHPSRESARWPTVAIRALVTVMYVVGALAKLDWSWTSGFVLGEAFKHYHNIYQRVFAVDVPEAFQILAIGSLLTEAFMAGGLWFKRTRMLAFVLGSAFHIGIDLLLPVRVFSWVMIASYIVFFSEEELRPVIGWWQARGTLSRALIAALAATGCNFILANLLGLQRWPQRNMIALVLAVTAVVGAWLVCPRLRTAQDEDLTLIPRRARVAVVATLAAIELFLATKPLYGFDNRFGWRMFTEVVRLRASAEALTEAGWEPMVLDERWSDTELAYYWDSLGEQRSHLRAYALYRMALDPKLQAVRVKLTYQRNRALGKETMEIKRP